MKLYVGNTDHDWFDFHSSKANVEEVNFWRPSAQPYLKDLEPGAPFLFRLKAPEYAIAGGGFFLRFRILPLSQTWDIFREANGAQSFEQFRRMISKLIRRPITPNDDPMIGSTILGEPFFFRRAAWIDSPTDFRGPIVSGKSYDMTSGEGLRLWQKVATQLAMQKSENQFERSDSSNLSIGPATHAAVNTARYGTPYLVAPRLGQGTFRIDVTEAYRSRCAMTQERTLPALEAAHIHRYSAGGIHQVSNGLLLRSDLHRLFDRGYITVHSKDLKILVSRRIKQEFENGHEYYELHGNDLTLPTDVHAMPSAEYLEQHNATFRE
jgi:putative restriction endonuclease